MTYAYPSVYSIEISSACNLKCPKCIRTTEMKRGASFIDLALIDLITSRDVLRNTSYVELQMAGEPTLHPEFPAIVETLRGTGVLVGLSTNGLLVRRAGVLDGLLAVDAVTFSIDAVDPDQYAALRPPGKLADLDDCIDAFFVARRKRKRLGKAVPVVDLQLVDQPNDVAVQLSHKAVSRGWFGEGVRVRSHNDCFGVIQNRVKQSLTRTPPKCANPLTSVSITAQGDVVSCCFVFDPGKWPENTYGNLHTDTLESIWQESENAHRLRHAADTPLCMACMHPSPPGIHASIVAELVKSRR